MSVPNQTPYIIYNANGLTTVFPFEFYIISASDIQVSINGTVVTSGYTVSGVGNVSGGDIVFLTPPVSGTVVMLERVVPTYRLTDYQDNGDLLADTVNKDFDRLWMAIQRSFIYLGLALRRPLFGGPFDAQGYRISKGGDPVDKQDFATKNYVDNVSLVRALRVPEAFVAPLPPVEQRKNKIVAMDNSGDPLMVLPESGSAADVMIELAKPTGDSLIGTKGGLTQKDKNAENPSIQDFGGRDDWNGTTGTDNTQAIIDAYGAGVRLLRLPKTDTGVYHFGNTASAISSLKNLVLDNEASVSIHHSNDNVLNIMRRPGYSSIRYLNNIIDGPAKFNACVSSQMFKKPSEKFLTAFEPELHRPEGLQFASSFSPQYFKATGWPAIITTFTSADFTIVDSSTITFTPPNGQFWGVMFSAVVGDHLEASSRDGNQVGVAVETTGGIVIARQNLSGSYSYIHVNKVEGGVSTEIDIPNIGGMVAPYYLKNSVLGVYLIDERTFALTCNGVTVAKIETSSDIVSAGWCNGYSTVPATISHPSRIRGRNELGVKPLSIVCIGDSTGDNAVTIESQFEYACDFIAGMSGCQIVKFNNLSVRGETANQQKTRLLATDITGYSHCLIQVGVNDIQGQTNMAGWLTQYADMITYCKSYNVTPIIGIPAMFYGVADIAASGISTDHIGQATTNSEKGVLYRLRLGLTAASNDVAVNYMGQSGMGQVIPHLITMAADPLVMDNIHPSQFGSMVMGMSWAKSLIADMTRSNKKGTWFKGGSAIGAAGVCTIPQRYFVSAAGTTSLPRYTVGDNGSLITLSYYLRQSSNWGTAPFIVGTLPERLRPVTPQIFVVQPHDSSNIPIAGAVVTVVITRDGTITVTGMPSSAWYLPFSITYRI